jgi:SNF2-related domain/Helicase conserved C-terminal domain
MESSWDIASFDVEAARQFLMELPADRRVRGEKLAAAGAVKELRPSGSGEFVADVEGETLVTTALRYDPETKFWWEECGCPAGCGCEHAAAAMTALLEAQASAVEEAKGGVSARKVRKKAAPPAPVTSGALGRWAAAALGRELSRAELEFLRRVEERFARLKEKPAVTGEDFVAMGLKFAGPNAWERLELWPAVPRDEQEFWAYLALAAEDRGIPWPEFLRPITPLDSVRERVEAWRRQRDVERWRNLLRNLHGAPGDDSAVGEEIELRLRLAEGEAVVEHRRQGALDFTAVKAAKFKDFDDKYADQLASEAALLWQPLAQKARYGRPVQLAYQDASTRRLLNRLFRLPAVQPYIVGADGEPLRRATEPLRWELDPAADEDDDYRLRLVLPDGRQAPKALAVLPGRPTLYLTSDTVWPCPPIEDRAVDPAVMTSIPAPAMETPDGLRFLQHHGIALPERLAARTRVVALQPVIRGELRAIAYGNDTEYAVLDVLGVTTDGVYQERWNGTGWIEAKAVREGAPAAATAAPESLETYDRTALGEISRLLEPAGFKWDSARQRWLLRVTARFPDVFTGWLQGLPAGLRIELTGELASFQNATVAGRVRLEAVEAGMDWFDLKLAIEVSDTQLTEEEIKVLLDARGKWVRLGGKGWRKLEFKLSAEEDAQFARLGLNPRELTSEPQRLHALQLADEAAKALLGEAAHARIVRRAAEIQASVTPETPTALKAELRPYQRDGFHFLCYLAVNAFGGILADDMGLGKTLQTLAWIAWLDAQRPPAPEPAPAAPAVPEAAPKGRKRGGASVAAPSPGRPPFLVVCPKSVTDNWRAETERFVPGLKVRVWSSEEVKGFIAGLGTADLHILNYNQLRLVGEALGETEFHAIILDEGQYIKNPTSVTAQLARSLKSRRRLVLSGTPIENKLLDLWSLMSFAMPGALGSRAEFSRLFDQKSDGYARQRLAARVRPFLLRRTKAQVAKDLPDRVEEDLFCELEGEQRTLYRAELKRAQSMLLRVKTPAALNRHRFNFLTSLLRLRQICCHPRLFKPETKAESAKVDALLETLEPIMEEGQKVLVFSQFVEMLDLLRATIAERGWPAYYLVGGTERRGDLVRQFQAHEGAAIFLISLKAGGFGLNLTAASYVTLFDPWWNPAVEAQAIDRSHRIGQTQKVIAYRLLIKNSVEEKIRALQRSKSQLAQDILGEEKFAQSLTLDDLKFLLED